MKKFIISCFLILICFSGAWAADKAPTVLSNKEAIDLVQTHADYVWTLVAALFHAGRIRHGGNRIYPRQKRHQYYDEKYDGFCHGKPGVLGCGVRPDVRCFQDGLVRDQRIFLK